MAGSTYEPKSKIVQWIEYRMPIFALMHAAVGPGYPTPKNLNYWWNFGSLAGLVLVVQIITGIVLAMHYTPSADLAFASIEHIMRDVNYGWLLRYIHANGGSMFFIVVYIHIFRGLYYGSYKNPRELLWMLGVVIFLLMMMTAFMGYVLPWGQMSFWGATVITNMFGAIPFVGDALLAFLWGDFAVDNATLNRFYSLHYLLPFVIVAVVIMHMWALHQHGSNNPLGIDAKGKQDMVGFHPYYTAKDAFGVVVFILIFAAFVFYWPNVLGHTDNYIPANRMVTPEHIVPEWYYLPFYAILRAITFDIGIPGTDIVIINAKFAGVILMFGSILVLFFLPWLDFSKVRSATFRPLYKQIYWLLVIDIIVLGYVGAQKPEGILPTVGLIGTAYYFIHFLVLMPIISKVEKPRPLPESISNPVIKAAE